MRRFGKDVSAIGMGCWAIGGPFYAGDAPYGYSNVDDAQSTRTIHAALDAGITLFDTANVYGAGHSERLLGAALKGRQDLTIVSKLGMAFDEETKQVHGHDADPANVATAIDDSLTRLQRDHIDVMLLHINALPVAQARPIFEAMEAARQAGKIGAFGWSTDFPQSAASMVDMEGFVCIENAMNVFVDVPTIQKTVETHDLISLIRSPLAMGVLTGKYDAGAMVPTDDVRGVNRDFNDYFQDRKVPQKYLKNIEAIREALQTGGRTLAQGALCWLLAKSEHNLPLPGAKTVAQITENAGAMGFGPLPGHVMDEIERLIDRDPEGAPRER